MKKIDIKIGGMSCAACSRSCQRALEKLDGVHLAQVNIGTETARVEYNEKKLDFAAIKKAITGVGFTVLSGDGESDAFKSNRIKTLKAKLIWAAIFTIPLFYLAMAPMVPFFDKLYPPFLDMHTRPAAFALATLLLTLPVMGVGYKFYLLGFKNLFKGTPNMDSLVAVGTFAAFVYSLWGLVKVLNGQPKAVHHLYFESTAVIITLILLGKYLEGKSKGKTGQAIKKLMLLAPKTAIVVRNSKELEIPVDKVLVGDIVLVRPGQRLPVDGVIVSGATAIDQSMLTGESIPADKTPGDPVYAATINKNGSITYTAQKVGKDTTLAQIIQLVAQASGSKAPIARLADTVSGFFVPIVMGIALVCGLGWFLATRDLEFALTVFISVLVIACPCALGLATPTAIITAIGRGASKGILFKNATSLENAHKIDTVVLDKTGTITKGEPAVTDVLTIDFDKNQLLRYAASVEKLSQHPLGEAVVKEAKRLGITLAPATDFTSETGAGITATVEGKIIKVGKPDFAGMVGQDNAQLSQQGKTCVYMSVDGKPAGVIAIADVIKPNVPEAVAKLKSMGLEVIMLTGDNELTAKAIAKNAGIDTVIAQVLPAQKAQQIATLQKQGKRVCMVGDGINDAVALTTADIGISVGSGTDIAIESADIVLVKNDIAHIPAAINLSRATMRNIKQNLFWAFFYNLLGIPVAAGVFKIFGVDLLLNPMIAAAAMSLSSVSVVTNALRLNRAKM